MRDTMPVMTTLEQHSSETRTQKLRVLGAVVAAAALIGVSWLITGPAPTPVDSGLPKSPPPMTVPAGTPGNSELAAGIADLAANRFSAATKTFTSLVAASPDDDIAQTGLILSGWRSDGPDSVEHDLTQLADEHPDDAYVALHLGLVRVLVGSNSAAEASFAAAVKAGRAAGDPTSLRMARLGDDLLHPDGFRSYVPVLVQGIDVPAADRAALGRLLLDIQNDDRVAAAKESKLLSASTSGMSRIASIVGLYEKGGEAQTASKLALIAADTAQPAAVRSRAILHEGLAQLWSGADRDAGCGLLAAAAGATADAATRSLSVALRAKLCR
jgi:hypothetical protein